MKIIQAGHSLVTHDGNHATPETPERRARRLFDEMARNIGREAVNYMKYMYPKTFEGQPKTAELSLVNHIRNDINYRMKPLLMAMIAMQKEWQAELEDADSKGRE